jgi:hypothetical protein
MLGQSAIVTASELFIDRSRTNRKRGDGISNFLGTRERDCFEGILKLAAGTSTEKLFEIEEGKVEQSDEELASLEQLDEIDFCRFWGHYGDGDKGDTPEANVERFVVEVERKKEGEIRERRFGTDKVIDKEERSTRECDRTAKAKNAKVASIIEEACY